MRKIYTIIIALIICLGINAQGHQLIVTTFYGGPDNRGAFFAADSSGNNFHLIYTCDSTGSEPFGDLAEGDNGSIYGVTSTGGCADSCVVYEYDVATGVFTDIHDFACASDSGEGACSGLIRGADGNLYGIAPHGGIGGSISGGVIYSIHPSDNSYHILHYFNDSLGSIPTGRLLQLSNGKFYGITNAGGLHDLGVVYSYDPIADAYSVLHSFTDTMGLYDIGGGLIQAGTGLLYGITYYGGLYGYGEIYSLDLNGNVFTVLHNFAQSDGANSLGELLQATDGKLYGATTSGGLSNSGVIFRFDPANNNYSVLHNFNTTDGLSPTRSLIQAANGKLFGTAEYGCTHLAGAVFSYDITIDSFAIVYEFDGITGGNPDCSVFEYVPKTITRVNEVNKTAELILSPNPATNSVSISVSEDLIGSTATLTDITGRKMGAVQLTTYHLQLTTSDFESGVYFITVSNGTTSTTKKLIINK